MNILESKYAKICTFVIFILSFFFYFSAKNDEFEIENEKNDENFDRNFEIWWGF